MNTATTGAGREAAEFAKELFLEDRDMPVSTAVQLIQENCNRALTPDEVASIRERILSSINRAMPADDIRPVQPRFFSNHPRLVVAKKPKPGDPMVKRGRPQVDVTEKRAWLEEWLKTQPRIPTIKEAQTALREHFGEALGTTFVANKLTEHHQKMFAERRKQIELEASRAPIVAVPVTDVPLNSLRETVKSIANLMRVNGIKEISVDDEGKIDFKASTAS